MRDLKKSWLSRLMPRSESEVFAQIVQQHAGMVYGTCLRILQDEDKAADAVQETFFQLVKNAEQITGSVAGWLHRVATNYAIDRIRRDSTRKKREQQYSIEQPHPVEQWNELSGYIDEEMADLDEETRLVLIRHFFEGETMRAIGRELGLSQATVSRRIQSAIETLRNRLGKRGLLVGMPLLVVLLGENAVQAAPAFVMTELGKMAIVGGSAALASGAGVTGASAATGSTAAGGILAGVKAQVVVAAAVVAIGAGTVVTVDHFSQPAQQNQTISPETSSRISEERITETALSYRQGQPKTAIAYYADEVVSDSQPPEMVPNMEEETLDPIPDGGLSEEMILAQVAQTANQEESPRGFGGGMMGGMGGGMGGYGGGMMRARSASPPVPDNANDPNEGD
jgi:RNA polymerase sigma factor (sigma-70 family)